VSVAMEASTRSIALSQAVGIDIEDCFRGFLVESPVRLRRFCEKMLTSDELVWYERHLSMESGSCEACATVSGTGVLNGPTVASSVALALLLFSLKESVYKALHPLLPVGARRYVHFKEVQIWLDAAGLEALLSPLFSGEHRDMPRSLQEFDSVDLNIPVDVTLLLPELGGDEEQHIFKCSAYFTRCMGKYWASCVYMTRE
jgi:phosphopantetheinyl transferase (holo-ACP synthase)